MTNKRYNKKVLSLERVILLGRREENDMTTGDVIWQLVEKLLAERSKAEEQERDEG